MSDLIERQKVIDICSNAIDIWHGMLGEGIVIAVRKKIEELPSAEPKIVLCKECRHRGEKPIGDGRYWCDIHGAYMYYCSDAERRTDGTD